MTNIRKVVDELPSLALSEGRMYMEYLPKAIGIEKLFAPEIRIQAFPPTGIAEPNELECYFILKINNNIVGYIKIVDLYFDGIIEVHGSYCGPKGFLVKTYFFISKKLLKKLQHTYPDKIIRTVIYKDNNNVRKFVNWLGFQEIQSDEKYIIYEIKATQY